MRVTLKMGGGGRATRAMPTHDDGAVMNGAPEFCADAVHGFCADAVHGFCADQVPRSCVDGESLRGWLEEGRGV